MKKKLMIAVASLTIAGAAALTLPSVFAEANVTPAPTPVLEHYPAIHHAIDALEEAKNELKHAGHDFGGHREAAIAECDKALFQLREAIKFAKD